MGDGENGVPAAWWSGVEPLMDPACGAARCTQPKHAARDSITRSTAHNTQQNLACGLPLIRRASNPQLALHNPPTRTRTPQPDPQTRPARHNACSSSHACTLAACSAHVNQPALLQIALKCGLTRMDVSAVFRQQRDRLTAPDSSMAWLSTPRRTPIGQKQEEGQAPVDRCRHQRRRLDPVGSPLASRKLAV